jgi:plasmid stability protein
MILKLAPKRNHTMNLSIKNVPDPVVQRLRERAKRRHRSLQGELLDIVERAAHEVDAPPDLDAVMARIRSLGLTRVSESVEMIRADRDGR